MKKARIICHRGASLEAPENTLAALEGAISLQADVIEFDIRASKDGVLYVFHDDELERTTNGSGLFHEHHSNEIDCLDAGSWFDAGFSGERVPRLDQFLSRCSGRIETYAEIKAADPREVRSCLIAHDLFETAWTFSFDRSIRQSTALNTPDFKRMVLFEHVGSVDAAAQSGAVILEFHEGDLSANLINSAREQGLVTQLFYAGCDECVFKKAVELGIDQMNIDHVREFRQIEAELHANLAHL